MREPPWTHVLAAICGGLVVAAAMIAFGYSTRGTTRTVVQTQAPAGGNVPGDTSSTTLQGIYSRDAPGVVMIRAVSSVQVKSPYRAHPVPPKTVTVGSGFLVTRSGDILTSYHVVEGATPAGAVTVQFGPGVTRTATVVHTDVNDDVALLHVSMKGVSAVVRQLEPGSSAGVRVGDPVLTLANPYGVDRTLSSVIVSAMQRQLEAPDGYLVDDVIQIDGTPGVANSGAPLLNTDGHVIGVMSQVGQVAFAVPIDDIPASWLPPASSH
jgi:S1-C subfamily serine protease